MILSNFYQNLFEIFLSVGNDLYYQSGVKKVPISRKSVYVVLFLGELFGQEPTKNFLPNQ